MRYPIGVKWQRQMKRWKPKTKLRYAMKRASFLRQSYELMQEAKRYDDEQRKKDSRCKKHFVAFDYINGKPICPICGK